jgi:alkylation response protein AidB-like acyl-CoA dehydrogenase
VTANAVACGLIKTRLTEAPSDRASTIDVQGLQLKVGVNPDLRTAMERTIPLGRAGVPAEAAGAVYLCVERHLRGDLDGATASMAKAYCTEVQGKVVDRCLQLFGGYGYMLDYPIARMYIDARVQRIYAGATEVMKELIARSLLHS